MGKGSTPRPVSKNYGENFDRIFGKRCLKHRLKDCAECFPPPTLEQQQVDAWDP